MTIDEFLDRLSETPRDWYIREDGRIRRRRYGLQIQCPITALCDNDDLRLLECAQHLGLSNGDLWKLSKQPIPIDHDHDLRMKLLKACGLEELTT